MRLATKRSGIEHEPRRMRLVPLRSTGRSTGRPAGQVIHGHGCEKYFEAVQARSKEAWAEGIGVVRRWWVEWLASYEWTPGWTSTLSLGAKVEDNSMDSSGIEGRSRCLDDKNEPANAKLEKYNG